MRNVIVVVLVVVLVGAGTAGGYVYGRQAVQNEAQATRSRFIQERGAPVEGAMFMQQGAPGGLGGPAVIQMRGPDGEATLGAVKAIAGSTLEMTTSAGEVKITVSDQTTIRRMVEETVKLADLQPGVNIIVTGAKDSQGVVTATSIDVFPRLPTNP